ncbi:MAG: Fic family protein [Endomicrobiaceae bacterium]|nr:Fic family protein [Endomicrobiaceae bacterium]
MDIGNKLKEYRESKNMTQKEIADIIEVKPATISKYESGTLEPNIETLKKLCEVFDVTLDELVKDKKDILDINRINILEVLREQKELKLKGNLYYNTQIAFTYNTNHIEGSTLTEEQTRYIYETNTVLFESNTIANVNDIIETTNHFKLIDYMLDIADKKLTENIIKEFHRILKEGTLDSRKDWFNVGQYKNLPNTVGDIKTSTPQNVEKDMQKLLQWYNDIKTVTIKDIIEFHAKFEKIHPFQDGNGRIGRLIIFKECLKNSIIPFIILDKDKLFYYRGLKEYQLNKEKGYLIDTCLNAQDQYIKMVEMYLKR